MILEALRAEAGARASAWAKELGLDPAPAFALQPAPPHVKADVSLPYPLAAAKALKRSPLDAAKELAALLANVPGVSSAQAAPPGFVNLVLDDRALARALEGILSGAGPYGFDPGLDPQRILLEFVSANPTGPVHVASARAATLGDCLARILSRRGHEVRSEYYVNDAGKQAELLGLSVKARRDGAELPENGYQGGYIKELAAEAPAEAAAWPPERFARFAVERMLEQHKRDMELFGVRFDRWFRESELHEAKSLDSALAELRALGRVYEKDGAVWLGSSAAEDDKDRVLVRADGRPTYFLGDIAYHRDKYLRGFDKLIDVWGADHHGYVPRMKAAVAALGKPPESFQPVVHQLVHLMRGKEAVKMSKRAGEFVTLRELVEEAGIDACRFFFAMRGPNVHMNFDLELAKKQSQENPVYYVQYVHARVRAIFREAEKHGLLPEPRPLAEPAARALLLKLAWFPEALRACERELSPHPLAVYLLELSGLFHPFYEQCRVVDAAAPELSRARLALCGGVERVIKDGLSLLGVSSPERM